MTSWTVRLDAHTIYPLTDEQVGTLLERLEPYGGALAVDGSGRLEEVTMSIDDAPDPLEAAAAAGAALDVATANLNGEILGTLLTGVEVITWAEDDRRLAQPAYPELVGVTELAQLLGVSRQRASELQKRPGFPAPVQILAAGPVWPRAWIERFVGTWERKPGRPRKVDADAELKPIDDLIAAEIKEAVRDEAQRHTRSQR